MADPQNRERFELRRQSDTLVHVFVCKTRPDGTVGYQRQDQDQGQDFWIWHRPDWGVGGLGSAEPILHRPPLKRAAGQMQVVRRTCALKFRRRPGAGRDP